METNRWEVPQTEEGLQTLLAQLEESRKAGDEAAVGRGLLALAWMVKWVRSDNDEQPFMRSVTLTNEALDIFRRIGDIRGQLAALRDTSPFIGKEELDRRSAEALRLAEELGDEFEFAKCLAARGKTMRSQDRGESTRLSKQALEIFLRLEENRSAAHTLFSLAIGPEDRKEGFELAKEGARLFRLCSDSKMAAKCAQIAVMNGEEFLPWPELECVVRQGLADAIAAGADGSAQLLYGHLAKVAAANGNGEEAAECLVRQAELEEADGLTPRQRRAEDTKMAKMLVEMCKASGNEEGAQLFEKELRRRRRPSQKAV